jgi:hypothetical protein
MLRGAAALSNALRAEEFPNQRLLWPRQFLEQELPGLEEMDLRGFRAAVQ